jgi:hypothetical protein
MILDKEELLAVFDETVQQKPRKNPRITGYSNTGDRAGKSGDSEAKTEP